MPLCNGLKSFFAPWTIVALLTRCKAKDFSSFSVRVLVHPRSCAVALACTKDETKPLVMYVCETGPESLFSVLHQYSHSYKSRRVTI